MHALVRFVCACTPGSTRVRACTVRSHAVKCLHVLARLLHAPSRRNRSFDAGPPSFQVLPGLLTAVDLSPCHDYMTDLAKTNVAGCCKNSLAAREKGELLRVTSTPNSTSFAPSAIGYTASTTDNTNATSKSPNSPLPPPPPFENETYPAPVGASM